VIRQPPARVVSGIAITFARVSQGQKQLQTSTGTVTPRPLPSLRRLREP
jgi:hypothetical protein